MRGYTVHVVFHLLALLAGGACGVAAGLWFFGGITPARWAFVGALVTGIVLLTLQLLLVTRGGTDHSHSPGASVRSSPRIDIHSPAREHGEGGTRTHDSPTSTGASRTGTTRPDLEPVDDPSGSADERTSVTGPSEQRDDADPTKRW